MKRIVFCLFVLPFFATVVFSQKITAPAPFGALPGKHQLNWQKMEYYMFIHFGPNTFTDKEWGHGDEDPAVFNPTQLDARQWARTAKAAGMKGIIITAKHHDGFCLWPSKYSAHTVRESAWKNGKGDVLRELSDACREYGLKFGVYLSPWDRNHPAYGTPEYNTIFANTLKEVLTNYGSVFEQWFDGANGEGPGGKKQEYDWNLFHKTVYENQPQAIIFSDVGPGCRWVGNEQGFAGTTNWATLNTDGYFPGRLAPGQDVLNKGDEGGKYWVPAECDVSIRPGWFYSASTDTRVKSVQQLLNIYYASVGRNSNMLLNVPVDRRGLIHANDSLRLMEFKKILDESFHTNLARGKQVAASGTRAGTKQFSAFQLTDNNYETYWSTDDNTTTASLTLDLGKLTSINRVLLQEYIPLGQRVKSFSVEYWDGKKYKPLDKQSTIGYKRILRFPAIQTSKLRINILEALACPAISELQVFNAPELLSQPVIKRNKNGMVSIESESADAVITYTLDGKEPTYASSRFKEPFLLAEGGTVKTKAFINNGKKFSETVSENFDLAPTKWSVKASEKTRSQNIIDGDPSTFGVLLFDKQPAEIIIDLGQQVKLKGFTYLPRQDGKTEGIAERYSFYVSDDGEQWTKVRNNARFSNIRNNPVLQEVKFEKAYAAKFIKIEAVSLINENDKTISAAEIGVLTR